MMFMFREYYVLIIASFVLLSFSLLSCIGGLLVDNRFAKRLLTTEVAIKIEDIFHKIFVGTFITGSLTGVLYIAGDELLIRAQLEGIKILVDTGLWQYVEPLL